LAGIKSFPIPSLFTKVFTFCLSGIFQKQPNGDILEKLIASYQHASNGYDEDTLFGKCRAAITAVIKVEREIGSDFNLGNVEPMFYYELGCCYNRICFARISSFVDTSIPDVCNAR